MREPSVVPILGIPIHPVTMDKALTLVEGYMAEPRVHQIATVNPEFVMAAQSDPVFRYTLRTADLCLPDGVGLLYAARRLGRPLPERVPGSEFIYRLVERAAGRGWPLFLLGAAPGVADEAARIFRERYPGLRIAGAYAGSPAAAENDGIVRRINDSGATLLFVAYGAPKQDKWIERNRNTLEHVRVAVGVGGSLDFVTGRAVRAPQWARDRGLEWLHRLYKEPWRWRRMLALPRFALRVIFSKA
jgi:N-acetylglucosaminyldiphosphoundecaprenol N-acetyl-beta-D-mannosaminyltransferase